MSKIFSMSLYFVSFLPLWISIIFIDLKSIIGGTNERWTEIISITCILIGMLFSLIVLMIDLTTHGKEGSTEYQLVKAKEEKAITAEFLLSYILPLFAFDFTQWDQVVLFLIFFCVLGFLCIRHNYFSVNIVLEFARFRFYECCLKNSDGIEIEGFIISQRQLNGEVGNSIYLKQLNNDYRLDIEHR